MLSRIKKPERTDVVSLLLDLWQVKVRISAVALSVKT